MKAIPLGARGTFALVVKPAHLADQFKDAMLPPVFSTPVLVMVLENAALNAVRDYLEAGESAVGIRIDVRHLAPTPVGMRVVGEAEVTAVEGRRVVFRVTARDQREEIGRGLHERLVIDMARFARHLEAKRAT